MLKSKIFLIVFVGILLGGCKSYYIVSDFDERTTHHKSIAILPVEMVFTGKMPDNLTDEDLIRIGDAESKAFMISFYNEVLRSNKRGARPFRVNIQHYDRTLSLLAAAHISVRDAWHKDPAELSEILGVDAVIKGRIEKHRLMSDLASYGIDLGVRILAVLSDHRGWWWLPAGATTAKEIKANYSLVGDEGSVLWSISYDVDADWRQAANEIIDDINRRAVRYFPYRVR